MSQQPPPAEANVRFSHRIAWESPANELNQILSARLANGTPVLDLTVSNPTAVGLGNWDDALHRAFAEAPAFEYAPQPEGLLCAREAVAKWYEARRTPLAPVALSAGQIFLTASSSESYAFLFQALCDPGEEVLAPLPSYPLFEFLSRLNGVELRSYRLRYHGEWHLDFASLEAAITPRTRAVIVVNPNNPTGNYLRREEYTALLALCKHRGLALIADEVFEEFPLRAGQSSAVAKRASFSHPQRDALCVSLGGLSKSAGLPQMKAGWMILNGPSSSVDALRERLSLVSDTYLSVSTPVQLALSGLLEIGVEIGDAIRARTQANLAALQRLVASAPHLTLLPADAGWSAVLRLPAIRTDAAWSAGLLNDAGILTQPGYFYDFDGDALLVISLLAREPTFAEGASHLCAYVEEAANAESA